MGTVGEIAELLARAHEYWEKWQGRKPTPRRIFEEFVAPSYSRLREVHEDYVGLYLELAERITLHSDRLSEITTWFSRARTKKQFDRSELRQFDAPLIPPKGAQETLFNTTLHAYVGLVQEYFLPGATERGWREFLDPEDRWDTTRSSLTERRLAIILNWLTLSDEDRRAFLAMQYLGPRFSMDLDRLSSLNALNELLRATAGESSDLVPELQEIDARRRELALAIAREAALPNAEEEPALVNPEATELDEDTRFERHDRRPLENFIPNWKKSILHHIESERHNLERAVKKVQGAYYRLRVIANDQILRKASQGGSTVSPNLVRRAED